MTDNNFNSEEINLQLQPLPAYIDSNGAFKLNTPMLSSYDFDGSIPKITGLVNAGDIKPGYLIQLTVGGQYFPVTSIQKEDPDLEDSPTGLITINYLNNQGTTIAVQYNETDSITAVYEDWDNKIVGNRGWGITSGGNAIFANVGVRGEIEATTMDIGGATGITYDGSAVIIGASVVINAPVTFNGVTPESLSASLSGYIPDGEAANDINTNITTINGGKITTGSITADKIDVDNLIVKNLLTNNQTNNSRIGIQPSTNQDRINFYSGLISGPGATEVVAPNVRTAYTYSGGLIKPGDQGVTISSGTNTSTTSEAAIDVLASRTTLGRSVNAYADYYNFNSVNSTFYAWDINFSGTITGNGSGLTNLNGTNIATGTVAAARIADLDANKITSGTIAAARLPSINAVSVNSKKIDSGTAVVSIPADTSWSGTVSITFNITFATVPHIVVSTITAANYYGYVSGATLTGGTIGAAHRQPSGTATATTVNVRWIAVGT